MRMTDKQRKIVEQNHNLIYDFLNKNCLDEEECYGIVAIGLCKAAMGYESRKGKFSTFAYKCMGNEVKKHFKYINGKTKIPQEKIFSYDILLDEDENESCIDIMLESDFNTYEIVEKNISYANFSKELNDREKFIVKCFESGLNQTEIAKKIGVTPQSVSQSVGRMRSKWNELKNK